MKKTVGIVGRPCVWVKGAVELFFGWKERMEWKKEHTSWGWVVKAMM